MIAPFYYLIFGNSLKFTQTKKFHTQSTKQLNNDNIKQQMYTNQTIVTRKRDK